MADETMDPPKQTQVSGAKLDNTYPDGVGKPSVEQPNLPSPQPVKVPGSITRPWK